MEEKSGETHANETFGCTKETFSARCTVTNMSACAKMPYDACRRLTNILTWHAICKSRGNLKTPLCQHGMGKEKL